MKHVFSLHWLAAATLALAAAVSSCTTSNAPLSRSAEPRSSGASRDGAYAVASAEEAPASRKPQNRPGLGTRAGSDSYSTVNDAVFYRKATGSPDAVDSFHYNDEKGAEAMAEALGGGRKRSGEFTAAGGRVKVSLTTWGDPLGRFEAAGRRIVIGQPGQVYSLRVRNETKHAIEVVASVDGLDVMDGGTASVRKRGYVIPKDGSVTIDGFRKDASTVKRFIFSSVDDSRAAGEGKARNVGVIGLAVYDEDEAAAKAAQLAEAQKRQGASAFPGQ